jgi:hypothetical protein
MNNAKIVICATIAAAVAGITLFEKPKKIEVKPDPLAEKSQERLLELRELDLDTKANRIAFQRINKRIKKGAYRSSPTRMLIEYNEQYAFERIAVRTII